VRLLIFVDLPRVGACYKQIIILEVSTDYLAQFGHDQSKDRIISYPKFSVSKKCQEISVLIFERPN
jgi:hypothetical protein